MRATLQIARDSPAKSGSLNFCGYRDQASEPATMKPVTFYFYNEQVNFYGYNDEASV